MYELYMNKGESIFVFELVVDLELHQRGVAGHGLDYSLHALCGDEVRLNVKTLETGVLLQHLRTCLHTETFIYHTNTLIKCNKGYNAAILCYYNQM